MEAYFLALARLESACVALNRTRIVGLINQVVEEGLLSRMHMRMSLADLKK